MPHLRRLQGGVEVRTQYPMTPPQQVLHGKLVDRRSHPVPNKQNKSSVHRLSAEEIANSFLKCHVKRSALKPRWRLKDDSGSLSHTGCCKIV